MDELRIRGGNPLVGEISISGSKNASLPILAASILTEAPVTLSNIPDLKDVRSMLDLLRGLGIETTPLNAGKLTIQAAELTSLVAPYELVSTMRASFLVLGSILARYGRVSVSLPGGCAIGTRPVDQHLKAFAKMGAKIDLIDGYVHANTDGRLRGTEIEMDVVTVGGTQNVLMAATLADGTTVIHNAAREPEVVDLASFLRCMGASIKGDGTSTITVTGTDTLHGCEFQVMSDRIETGTYLAATLATHGCVRLLNANPSNLIAVTTAGRMFGADITVKGSTIDISARRSGLSPVSITTAAYPGIPTDLQAQLMVVNCLANGVSTITETVFENRFMHIQELVRMGADIFLKNPTTAVINGVSRLSGTRVMATDLRASSCLVIGALAAQGESIIGRIYHLDRGYERMEDKLASLGGMVERTQT